MKNKEQMKYILNTTESDFELQRLNSLREYPELTNEDADPYLEKIVSLAAKVCDVPIAAITVLDEQRQIFKAIYGLEIKGTERSLAFCNYTIKQDKIFEVNDAKCDRRFQRNPLVQSEPYIRFYAGVPLVAISGDKLGALCVIDRQPNELSDLQRDLLTTLAASAMEYLGHKHERNRLEAKVIEMDNFFFLSPDLLCEATMDGYFRRVSHSFVSELGYSETELLNTPFMDFVHDDDKQDTESVMQKMVNDNEALAFFHNRYRCKNGQYIKLSWNAIPLGSTKTIYATARNITELERLKEEISRNKQMEIDRSRDSFTALSQMTKLVSLELLEPANLIIGFASVLESLVNEISEIENKTEMNVRIKQIVEDLSVIQRQGEFMSKVLKKMNLESEWYQIPSVINGKKL
jgi:PAS domain S-box-containing protein